MSGMTWKEYMERTEQYAQQFPQHIANKGAIMATATKEKAEPRFRIIKPTTDSREIKLYRPTRYTIGMDWPCGSSLALKISKVEKVFEALDQIKAMKALPTKHDLSQLTIEVNLGDIADPSPTWLGCFAVHTKGSLLHITEDGDITATFSLAKLKEVIDQVKNDPIGEPNE